MDDREISEMLEGLGYGEKPPEALMAIVRDFRRRKSIVFPTKLTVEDVVTSTIIYDMLNATAKRNKREQANG